MAENPEELSNAELEDERWLVEQLLQELRARLLERRQVAAQENPVRPSHTLSLMTSKSPILDISRKTLYGNSVQDGQECGGPPVARRQPPATPTK